MTTLRKANGLATGVGVHRVVRALHAVLGGGGTVARQWQANVLAWTATAVALLLLGWHWLRLQRLRAPGPLSGWVQRLAQGTTALAGVAVMFSALPSFVFLP